MKRHVIVAVAAFAVGVVGTASAQAPSTGALPTGESVVARFIEVTGGAKAYLASRTRVTHARMEIEGTGVIFAVTVYQARPDLTYSVADAEATGRIESGVLDGVAWEKSSRSGPIVKAGQERDDAIRDAQFDRLVKFRDMHKKVECVAIETVEGKPAYKVVLTPNIGSAVSVYFDRESGLLVKTEVVLHTSAGEYPMVSYPTDYRQTANGIRLPFTTMVSVAGQTRIVTVERIEGNVEIPAERFALPAEIKALVAARK